MSADVRERLEQRLKRWAERVQGTGLGGVLGPLLGAASPLSILGAQLLWVAQPALGLLAPRDEIEALAQILSEPEGVVWLRQTLTGHADDDESA